MDSEGTRLVWRGGCFGNKWPYNLLANCQGGNGANDSPETTGPRRGFRTFLHLRQSPQTKERDAVTQAP